MTQKLLSRWFRGCLSGMLLSFLYSAILMAFETHVDKDGVLHITIKDPAGEHVTIQIVEENGQKYVKVNDQWPFNPQGNSVHPHQIKGIVVHGGPGNDYIDLRGVTKEDFTELKNSTSSPYHDFHMFGSDVTVLGGDGNDTIYGSDANDVIQGQNGNDTIFGGDGHDGLYGEEGNDSCYGGKGNDFVYGYYGDDIIKGGEGDDELNSHYGNDYMNGDDGNDIINGLPGSADIIADSIGIDSLAFIPETFGIIIDLDLMGSWQIVNADSDSMMLSTHFEEIAGSIFDDIFYIDPDTVPRFIDGGDHIHGDTLYFDAKGNDVLNDGIHLIVGEYDTVTYLHFETIIYEHPSPVEMVWQHPSDFSLSQNYPNPFNAKTMIRYTVKTPCHVVLKVFNLQGRELATLINAKKQKGSHTVQFNTSGMASGIYLYRIQMGYFMDVKKMVLLQ